MRVVLGSKSPRRQELLRNLGFDIEIRVKEIDETYPPSLPSCEVAEYLAVLKSKELLPTIGKDELLITSDTTVVSDEKILGKPTDRDDAISMITALSGSSHHVITGVCLTTENNQISFSSATEVFFDNLTRDEIEYYVDQYEPYDKAGAYGIQEWIGYVGVKKIIGCYYNVMGLPLQELYKTIKREFPEFISL